MNKQIEKVISRAKSYVGTSEDPKGSNRNRFAKMIDEKFPDFYNGKKNGSAWCDEFVDAIFLEEFGEEEALRLLCQPKKSCGAGCKFSAQYYKSAGRFFDKPEAGDQIFFYVSGDINHTGIVTKVDDKKVYTTEGNSGDMVKDHSYSLDNKKIAGYGRPRWKEEAETIADSAPVAPTPAPVSEKADAKKSNEDIAREVLDGKWGNGKERQQRLAKAGYDYNSVQKIVNQILNAKPSNAASSQKAETFIGIVNTVKDRLNVRTGAGMNYPAIKTLAKGSKIELYKKMVNGWYRLADGSGYVAGNLIKK